jgi:hypothetical protein
VSHLSNFEADMWQGSSRAFSTSDTLDGGRTMSLDSLEKILTPAEQTRLLEMLTKHPFGTLYSTISKLEEELASSAETIARLNSDIAHHKKMESILENRWMTAKRDRNGLVEQLADADQRVTALEQELARTSAALERLRSAYSKDKDRWSNAFMAERKRGDNEWNSAIEAAVTALDSEPFPQTPLGPEFEADWNAASKEDVAIAYCRATATKLSDVVRRLVRSRSGLASRLQDKGLLVKPGSSPMDAAAQDEA